MSKPTTLSNNSQNLTAANLNSTVTLTVPEGAAFCRIYVIEATQGSGYRLWITEDGTTPSASVGGVLPTGVYTYRTELAKIRLLNETSSGCRAYVVYFQE